jgi:hypothetical protein
MNLSSKYYSDLAHALRMIKNECGQVCDDFELCTHRSCQSSSNAWFIAEAALSGRLDELIGESKRKSPFTPEV